jgi:hypothetical protein
LTTFPHQTLLQGMWQRHATSKNFHCIHPTRGRPRPKGTRSMALNALLQSILYVLLLILNMTNMCTLQIIELRMSILNMKNNVTVAQCIFQYVHTIRYNSIWQLIKGEGTHTLKKSLDERVFDGSGGECLNGQSWKRFVDHICQVCEWPRRLLNVFLIMSKFLSRIIPNFYCKSTSLT